MLSGRETYPADVFAKTCVGALYRKRFCEMTEGSKYLTSERASEMVFNLLE
jgi:hypothetical protein